MALKLLRVLVVVVFAAAADDVPIKWSTSSRLVLPCVVPEADRVPQRRPPPPLDSDSPRSKPYLWWRRDDEKNKHETNGPFEVRRDEGDGVYQCAVRHFGGFVLGYPVHVKFAYMAKQFTVHPQNATARIGQPFAISCDIDSSPSPTVSWLKDDQILPEDTRYHVLSNQLLITDLWSTDAGVYRCIATNPQTRESRTSRGGRVQVASDAADLDPWFLQLNHQSNVAVARGSRVTLPCPVVGWPRPNLIWKITPRSGRQAELELTDEVLVLERIEYDDQEGIYTCEIEDTDLVKTFNVTITEPPVITIPPMPKETPRASTVRFNCTASGRPDPKITWYKDGQLLAYQPGGRINERTSPDGKRIELIISGVFSSDAGVYQCFAQNSVSITSSWATLNVTGADAEPPTGLQCWPESVKEVHLRWDKPPADKVVAYTVHITPLDARPGSSLPRQPLTNKEEEVTVGEPLTPYMYQVRAYIKTSATVKNIASDLSQDVICQGQGVPIRLVKLGDGSILVTWRHFADHNPGVVQWILQCRVENSSEVRNVTLDGSVHNYTLNASPSKPLQIRLLGSKNLTWLKQNLTGVPWTSSSTAGKDLDDGDITAVPDNLEVTEVGSRGFTVTWQCDEADSSSDKYYFMVCIRKEDDIDKCHESKLNSATFEDLQPSSKYELRVQARVQNRALGGAFSEPYFVTTQAEGPQRFRYLTGQYVNSTTLRISWNGAPAKYKVHYSSELRLPVEQWASVKTMNNTVLISDIDPSKKTYIMVIGYNPEENSKIETILPREAKDLQYEYTSSGVRISWTGPGPRVVCYAQNITRPVEQWPSIDVTESFVELTDLDPSLTTYVMVTSSKERSQVLTIMPRPKDSSTLYLGLGISGGILILCLMAVATICIWRKLKRNHSPVRSRRRNAPAAGGNEEEGSEMKNIGGRLANGGGSKDAGEPLLNGHVHITENPTSKTPNGKMKKPRLYEAAFDVSRNDDPDTTLETVLEADTSTSTTYNLLDTSRRPEFESRSSRDVSANNSFNKLPDDNMNSELTRSTDFELDNSKIQPTLQPNG